ncbi:MAG: VOC family protein [Tepidiformaceae bacterium]
MRLAKNHIDVGMMTGQVDAQLAFWQQEIGLSFEELLLLGGGRRQHRHGMNGSVLKINESRGPLPDAPPAGYRELLIARQGLTTARRLVDADGNRVSLVPSGEQGVTGIGVHLAVRDASAFDDFYGRILGLERVRERAYRWGDSLLEFEQDSTVAAPASREGPGYRYLTVQVWDVDADHAALLALGAAEGSPPVTLGQTARISFIRDPDGNWIEVSQRASLTGALPH